MLGFANRKNENYQEKNKKIVDILNCVKNNLVPSVFLAGLIASL